MPYGWRASKFLFYPYKSSYYRGGYYVLVKARLEFDRGSPVTTTVGLFWLATDGERLAIKGKIYDHVVYDRYRNMLKFRLAQYLEGTKPILDAKWFKERWEASMKAGVAEKDESQTTLVRWQGGEDA